MSIVLVVRNREQHRCVCLIAVAGEVGEAPKILLVFRAGDMITSAGIAVLFDLIMTAEDQGQEVRIVQPAAHFRKVFDLVGLSKCSSMPHTTG